MRAGGRATGALTCVDGAGRGGAGWVGGWEEGLQCTLRLWDTYVAGHPRTESACMRARVQEGKGIYQRGRARDGGRGGKAGREERDDDVGKHQARPVRS